LEPSFRLARSPDLQRLQCGSHRLERPLKCYFTPAFVSRP